MVGKLLLIICVFLRQESEALNVKKKRKKKESLVESKIETDITEGVFILKPQL